MSVPLDEREIRDNLKHKVHNKFDYIWKSGFISRSTAYTWLSMRMGLPPTKTHFTLFTIKQLEAAEIEVDKFYAENNLQLDKQGVV